MDALEIELLCKYISDHDLKGELNDEFFVNWINKSSDRLRSCLLLLKSTNQQNTSNDKLSNYFDLAVCSLQVFVLANWIYVKSIELDTNISNQLNEIDENDLKTELQLFDICYQPPIKYIHLLYLAKMILRHCSNDELYLIIWKLRYLTVVQSILDREDNQFDHEDLALSLINHLESQNLDKQLKMRFIIELCQHKLVQNKVQGVKELLNNASNLTDLEMKLSGALGKRTRFQKDYKSILFLNLTRKSLEKSSENNEKTNTTINLLKDVNLNDDTLLDTPQFKNNENSTVQLSEDEETLLLATIKFGSKCGITQDNLLKEELLAYVDVLIKNSTVWLVKFESMFQRSMFEKNERRKMERSMTQLNELIEAINENNLAKKDAKLNLFYSCQIAPVWKIKRKFAEILLAVSCVKEALNIYLELGLWENIVFCYQMLDRRDKAAAIIREKLAINETPYLLCLLGDATDEINCYEKAWQLSDGKSYLAQQRLGYHYYSLNDYHKAIECFEKSIQLNPNQLQVLQRLGYSALKIENYELAVKAYHRVIEFDLDDFMAWNNLSKAYIKLNDKNRAFRTLQEALKNNYDNWKIWENYIAVSIDVGAFSEVINAWNRLIDLKSKFEDDEIMAILVDQLCQTNNSKISNQSYLQKRTIELLGRMTANFQCSSELWLQYAKLLLHMNQTGEKIMTCLTRGQHALMSKPGWDKNAESIVNNLKALNQLYTYHSKVLESIDDEDARRRYVASFKLSSNSILSLIKNRNEYWSTDTQTEQIVKDYLDDFSLKFNDCSEF